MKTFTAVIEKCPDTQLFVGYVPGFPGAHTQAASLDELHKNLQEVLQLLLEDGDPQLEGEFIKQLLALVERYNLSLGGEE